MIKEESLQTIWKGGFLQQYSLITTGGKEVKIISPGSVNPNAGPDFFNAKIKIGSVLWAGNVELHLKSSDWQKHGHQQDGAYNNVILHVVLQEDRATLTSQGRFVETLQLEDLTAAIPLWLEESRNESILPCHRHIRSVSKLHLSHWLTKLQRERLERKCSAVNDMRRSFKLNWEETLLIAMASAMGAPLNSLPFEMTVKRIPFDLLYQNRDNLLDTEAMLFGQAGFLQGQHLTGPYEQKLLHHYLLKYHKFRHGPIDRHLWKFLRLRPASFPTLRLSQFASIIHTRLPLMDSILNVSSTPEIEQLLRVESSSYWDSHYRFGICAPESKKVLGPKSVLCLIINGVVPFLFSFGQTMNHLPAISLGNRLLEKTESESNQIIKNWAIFGIVPRDAFESQALIQLHTEYCIKKRCMDCQLGIAFTKS